MKGRIHSLESFGTVDGPGTRFVVFVQGCPMRCAYCHNPDTWPMEGGTMMEPAEIIEQYENNRPFYKDGGLTVTGGEPLMQVDFLIDLFTLAKEHGIHTCIDSSGIAYKENNTAFIEKLDKLMPLTDLVMLDIKHIDPEKHKQFTGRSNELMLENARKVAESGMTRLDIRVPVIPTFNDKPEEIKAIAQFADKLPGVKKIHLLPYHRLGQDKYDGLGRKYEMDGILPPDNAYMEMLKRVVQQNSSLYCQIGG